MDTNKEYLSIDDLCQKFDIGRSKAYELVKTKQIASCKIGRSWKIPKEAVDSFVNQEIKKRI